MIEKLTFWTSIAQNMCCREQIKQDCACENKCREQNNQSTEIINIYLNWEKHCIYIVKFIQIIIRKELNFLISTETLEYKSLKNSFQTKNRRCQGESR